MASEGGGEGGLEALFPPGGGGSGRSGETESLLRADGDGEAGELDGEDPELRGLRRRVQGWLRPYGGPLLGLQRLLVWERPLYSVSVALTLNTLFWLLSSTSLRPLFLLSMSLLGLMLLERWKHKLALITVQHAEPEPSQVQREAGSVEPRLLSVPELSHHLADSYLTCCLYLREMLQYKRQHHGKFCIMMCSGCAVLAVVGHYVPGIMISYIIALSVLLWPFVVYHELIQRMYTGLEPILMKLDYSMKGGAEHRKHDKRIIALLREVKKELESGDEPRAETESDSEEELSCFAPTVDAKTTALAMAITDSELSDEEASILESGGFSVSRATTPQLTDLSEDLDLQSLHSDPDESYLRDLPEFPSVQEFPSMEHGLFHFPLRAGPPQQGPQADGGAPEAASDGGEPLSPASLLLQHLASPLHFVNTHFNGHGRPPGESDGGATATALLLGATTEGEERGGEGVTPHHRSLEALSEEIVSTAISTVVQNTLSALLRSSEEEEEGGPSSLDQFLPTETPPDALEVAYVGDHATTSTAGTDEPEPAVAVETETTTSSSSPDRFLSTETRPDDAPETTARPAGGPAERTATEAEPMVGASTDDDSRDDPLVAAEDEDFELLDQSELEQTDEGLMGLGSDALAVGGALGAMDTPPPPPQRQPEES